MDFGWLSQIAPTIASCLGGPLAGLAVTALSKLFGLPPFAGPNLFRFLGSPRHLGISQPIFYFGSPGLVNFYTLILY